MVLLGMIRKDLDKHTTTLIDRDRAMLIKQKEHEGLLTLLRSDLDKHIAPVTARKKELDTHISAVIESNKAMLTEQQKHEDLITVLRGQFEDFKSETVTALAGVGTTLDQQNSLIRSDLNKKQTKLQEHENQLSVLSFREKDKQTKLEAHVALLSVLKTNANTNIHEEL